MIFINYAIVLYVMKIYLTLGLNICLKHLLKKDTEAKIFQIIHSTSGLLPTRKWRTPALT